MASGYAELDHRQTPMGELVLRRRKVVSLGGADVYEVKLDGEFLMSSLVNEAEIALATIALRELSDRPVDVLVGGLGLGHTANAALDHPHTRRVTVVEYMDAVIDWHRNGLVPLGDELAASERCRIVQGDFFEMISSSPTQGTAPALESTYDAILVDIDHSPACLLHPSHARFYKPEGLAELAARIAPGGVFALWSADATEAEFMEDLRRVFDTVAAHDVCFFNVLLGEEDHNTIYVCR